MPIFTPFSRLPPEIRERIWEESFPYTQIHILHTAPDPDRTATTKNKYECATFCTETQELLTANYDSSFACKEALSAYIGMHLRKSGTNAALRAGLNVNITKALATIKSASPEAFVQVENWSLASLFALKWRADLHGLHPFETEGALSWTTWARSSVRTFIRMRRDKDLLYLAGPDAGDILHVVAFSPSCTGLHNSLTTLAIQCPRVTIDQDRNRVAPHAWFPLTHLLSWHHDQEFWSTLDKFSSLRTIIFAFVPTSALQTPPNAAWNDLPRDEFGFIAYKDFIRRSAFYIDMTDRRTFRSLVKYVKGKGITIRKVIVLDGDRFGPEKFVRRP
ncbi:hypothetical protein F5Y16DRAFT_404810 [Xylariaceae sp. FL0255]|nr:hypothetical protein F5Y16DRAFT_404810 [Xylariaceae sp. FL0255]